MRVLNEWKEGTSRSQSLSLSLSLSLCVCVCACVCVCTCVAELLDPDLEPAKNLRFLLFLTATMKAVDDYGDLLRVSVATAGNDHRLGGNEAPPAIVSMFIGDDLAAVLDIVEHDLKSEARKDVAMTPGPQVFPHFVKDTTDRNRTSPFAFTGNKFEFRMPGSALSVSGPNVVLNTAVAEVLKQFADRLETVPPEKLETEVHILLKETIKQHRRIVFNGNGYTDEWVEEAHRRGLYDLPSCAEAFPCFVAPISTFMFMKGEVLKSTLGPSSLAASALTKEN